MAACQRSSFSLNGGLSVGHYPLNPSPRSGGFILPLAWDDSAYGLNGSGNKRQSHRRSLYHR